MGRLLGPRLAPAARVPLERSQPVPGLAEPSVTPDHRCCRLEPRAMPPSRCSAPITMLTSSPTRPGASSSTASMSPLRKEPSGIDVVPDEAAARASSKRVARGQYCSVLSSSRAVTSPSSRLFHHERVPAATTTVPVEPGKLSQAQRDGWR